MGNDINFAYVIYLTFLHLNNLLKYNSLRVLAGCHLVLSSSIRLLLLNLCHLFVVQHFQTWYHKGVPKPVTSNSQLWLCCMYCNEKIKRFERLRLIKLSHYFTHSYRFHNANPIFLDYYTLKCKKFESL